MKQLHWFIVALLVIALIGLPIWYSKQGIGTQTLAASESHTTSTGGVARDLRSSKNRRIVGGAGRFGK